MKYINIFIILILCVGMAGAQLETSTDIIISDGTFAAYYNSLDMRSIAQGNGPQIYNSASSLSRNESILEINYVLDGSDVDRTNRFLVELDAVNVGVLQNVDLAGFNKIKSDAYLESVKDAEDNLTSIYSEINIVSSEVKGKYKLAKGVDGKLQDQERFYIDGGLFNVSMLLSEDCFDVPGAGDEDWLACDLINSDFGVTDWNNSLKKNVLFANRLFIIII